MTDKMLYGMKEAGYYFYLLMFGMFQSNRFVANRVDPCVIHRFESGGELHGEISVDDCFFAVFSPDAKKAVWHCWLYGVGRKSQRSFGALFRV
jgi:hypothetical protein